MVQFSAFAAEVAGSLESTITLGPDLSLTAEELVARGDVADRAVEAPVVVVVDAGGDGGVGVVGRDGVDGARLPASASVERAQRDGERVASARVPVVSGPPTAIAVPAEAPPVEPPRITSNSDASPASASRI